MPRPETSDLQSRLTDQMVASGTLRSPAVEQAFRRVPRHHFLPTVAPEEVYRDEAIVTHRREGGDEWISSSSQPTMMAIMLDQLGVEPGMRVLEIGAGTGYNAALLAELTGDPALVWTTDVSEEFCKEAGAHLAAAGKGGVHVVHADGWRGWPDAAPYDRIIVTAAAPDIAPAWAAQLRGGGTLVLPWGVSEAPQRCLAFRKTGGALAQQSSHLCFFMPMRGAATPAAPAASEPGDHWEQPWANSPGPGPFVVNDLAFFLSLFFWPYTAIVFWREEQAQDRPGNVGLMDSLRRIVAGIEIGQPWKTIGRGDQIPFRQIESHTHVWFDWGCPTPDQLHLTAYPRGGAPPPRAGELPARREWFEYLVSRQAC